MTLSYRRPTEEDARLLLDWRLRPDISRHLFTQVEDDMGKQRAWLARSNARDDYHHRIMMVDGVPVGYASITITHAAWGIATLGAYMADRRGRTGSAPLNFAHALNHVFYALGLRKVVNQVMADNDRVLRGQTMLGYRHIGVLKDHAVKEGQAYDVHLFEISAGEWAEKRLKFREYADWDGHMWPPG
ncbi:MULTISPECIES: GNAT family N-acetyltransferase [Nitrospirillum]|uniref:RimJ/RimL family protein N-acetyltransferase n=1 Tax=Nitrospirillum amazonense TaxID=28077 RepID=A0A560FUT0_9PROT|nr:GNAT family N-acetyltransferase [Nitrospirillum amazonense]MEC4592593.1 GNAT family N-acetyltransferase [Nitrospirillum amazonense]TWB25349.1 RimJ/RimL family protein N-acetyltransferase [Nitrospirillum amazonense]